MRIVGEVNTIWFLLTWKNTWQKEMVLGSGKQKPKSIGNSQYSRFLAVSVKGGILMALKGGGKLMSLKGGGTTPDSPDD